MISVSAEVLEKINNPIQLPASNSEPHIYAMLSERIENPTFYDIAPYIQDGTVSVKTEDYIYSLRLTLMRSVFTAFNTDPPLTPDSLILIGATFGDSNEIIYICRAYIDEINDDGDSETFTVSATSAIGHYLKNTYCGEMITLSGYCHEVIAEIMDHAEVYPYGCTEGDYYWTYTFKASDTCYTALEQVCKIFPRGGVERDQPGFGIIETPYGEVFVGYWRHRQEVMPWGAYAFSDGHNVFSKNKRVSNDAVYSKIFANGKDVAGISLEQVIIDVESTRGVHAPANKIYFADFNGSTNQANLQDWADVIASEIQNSGITMEFTGPFRPQITAGDVAVITDDPDNFVMPQNPESDASFMNTAFAITSITHHFGVNGFSTDFAVDSGGILSAVTGWTSAHRAMGYTRHQNLVDLINKVADQVADEKLNMYDNVKLEEETYDDSGNPIKTTPDENNQQKIVYDGRNWQQIVIATGGNINPT